jgi:hypothetical protein
MAEFFGLDKTTNPRHQTQNHAILVSAHPEMANLPDISVARKI